MADPDIADRVHLLAIDSGVRIGWAKFTSKGLLHSWGLEVLDRHGSRGILAQAYTRTTGLLESDRPRTIAKEKGFAGRKGFDIEGPRIEGAILAAIEEFPKVPLVEVHQSTARKALLGFGGSMKRAAKDGVVREFVEDTLKIPAFMPGERKQVSQDPIDAIFVGLAWFKIHGVSA